MDETTGESKIWGVSIRSWCATFIIVPGMLTVCVLAFLERDVQWVMILVSSAVSFLFGKASGLQSATGAADVAVAAAVRSSASAKDSEYSAEVAEDSASAAEGSVRTEP
jgi:hypothetical protein